MMARQAKARCPRTGCSVELTESAEGVVRYWMNGDPTTSVLTTRAALLLELNRPPDFLRAEYLAMDLLRRFIRENEAGSDIEELTLP
jgi:hypothetical protein